MTPAQHLAVATALYVLRDTRPEGNTKPSDDPDDWDCADKVLLALYPRYHVCPLETADYHAAFSRVVADGATLSAEYLTRLAGRKCATCGTTLRRRQQTYCSTSCAQHGPVPAVRVCEMCGEEFRRKPGEPVRRTAHETSSSWATRRFCSRACVAVHKSSVAKGYTISATRGGKYEVRSTRKGDQRSLGRYSTYEEADEVGRRHEEARR